MANFINMNKERSWIRKKMRSGISQSQLLHNVGLFSNKSKSKVKRQKRLSEKQYQARYKFLSNVYQLLEYENF